MFVVYMYHCCVVTATEKEPDHKILLYRTQSVIFTHLWIILRFDIKTRLISYGL